MAYFTREIGELNQVVALWGYQNPGDREKRRKVIFAAPRWRKYPKRFVGLTDVRSMRILNPVCCSPLQ